MIERLNTAGLGYHVSAEETQERLGISICDKVLLINWHFILLYDVTYLNKYRLRQ